MILSTPQHSNRSSDCDDESGYQYQLIDIIHFAPSSPGSITPRATRRSQGARFGPASASPLTSVTPKKRADPFSPTQDLAPIPRPRFAGVPEPSISNVVWKETPERSENLKSDLDVFTSSSPNSNSPKSSGEALSSGSGNKNGIGSTVRPPTVTGVGVGKDDVNEGPSSKRRKTARSARVLSFGEISFELPISPGFSFEREFTTSNTQHLFSTVVNQSDSPFSDHSLPSTALFLHLQSTRLSAPPSSR